MITMTFEEWQAKYQPGERLDISTPTQTAVRAADPLTIWTELESDGGRTITNGFHFINREAHYICAVPFDPNEIIEIDDTDPDEDEEGAA